MPEEISLDHAKATLAALVRAVREGASYTITVHGEPVAVLRPVEPTSQRKQTMAERIAELEGRGEIGAARGSPGDWAGVAPRPTVPGALERFLAERG